MSMTIEQLRREVVLAIMRSPPGPEYIVAKYVTVRAAFDAYDKTVIAANKPTFEGDEAEVRRWLTSWTMDANKLSGLKALALLDAKDARIAELTEQVNEANRASLSFGNQCAAAVAKARDLEAALAEERKAMSEAASYAIEDLREWLVNYPDAYDRDTTEQAITTLSRFILPAKPAVDPLVGCLEQALMTDTKDGTARLTSNLRAAIERAGGVKAVFGEGGE